VSQSKIGIKIADGSFYPILDELGKGKKRLIVTTVKDNQASVQIDLYRGMGEDIADASYVGSLVIDNIEPAPKGEPNIELVVGIDDEGNLNASARDRVTNEKQSLSISLESLSEEGIYEIPEFELTEFEEHREEETGPEEEEEYEAEVYNHEEEASTEQKGRKKISTVSLIAFVFLGLVTLALIAFLIYTIFRGPPVPPLTAEAKSTVVESPTDAEVVDKPPEEKTRGSPEGAGLEEKELPEAKEQTGEGKWYYIKWGDTLWEISETFYNTPWLYEDIAKENKIKNPHRIFAGSTIYIPSRTK